MAFEGIWRPSTLEPKGETMIVDIVARARLGWEAASWCGE